MHKNIDLNEARAHMGMVLHAHSVYRQVGNFSDSDRTHWALQGLVWQNTIPAGILPYIPERMLGFMHDFLDCQPTPKLPTFSLLAKTHK